jgi:hypothetical protein
MTTKYIEKTPIKLTLRFKLGTIDSIMKNNPIKDTIKAKFEISLG